jgi:hypothetical protein
MGGSVPDSLSRRRVAATRGTTHRATQPLTSCVDRPAGGIEEFGGTQLGIIGVVLVLIGLVIALVGGVWLLIKAFQTSILWGLGSMFVPFVSLIFVFTHWEIAKRPFLISLAGAVFIIVGSLLGGSAFHPVTTTPAT